MNRVANRFLLTAALASLTIAAEAQATRSKWKHPSLVEQLQAVATSAGTTRPDIHGDQVVFTAEGDLWLCSAKDGQAHRLTADAREESEAHFSPDGTQIAFTANYDGGQEAYVMPVSGGIPKRLTYDSLGVDVLGWTPDGERVLYRTSSKMYASYVETVSTQELFTVPAKGGLPTKLPVPRGSFASLSPDSKRMAFVPTSNEWMNWFRYEAGEADSVWLTDFDKHSFEKLTNSTGVDTEPVWVGNTVYFVSERTGIRNLWSLDPATKAVKQLTFSTSDPVRYPSSDGKRVIFEMGPNMAIYDPSSKVTTTLKIHLQSDHIHARPFEFPVSRGQATDIDPSGRRVAMVVRGQLVTVAVGDGSMIGLVNDSNQRVQGASWSPDGKTIAYISDASGEEQIWLADASGAEPPKQLTHDLKGEHSQPLWSPDEKYLLIGDRLTNIQLVTIATGAVKTIASSQWGSSYDDLTQDFDFSPDAKWVVYSEPGQRFIGRVHLYNLKSGVTTPVTNPTIHSTSPAFSDDGLYLYFLQMRDVSVDEDIVSNQIVNRYENRITGVTLASATPSPFAHKSEADEEVDEESTPGSPPQTQQSGPPPDIKVDLDGISRRIFDLKAPAGDYSRIMVNEGRLFLLSDEGLMAFDLEGKGGLHQLAQGITGMAVSADGKKILVTSATGSQVLDAHTGPFGPSTGLVNVSTLSVTVDPLAEWKQIFNESWRVTRDFFYDPNMHGVDWNAVRTKYPARMAQVGDRADLTLLLSDMLSELNTGHCYVDGPSPFERREPRLGSLGIDLEYSLADKAYRISHILRGDAWSPEARSPLAEVGLNVKEGDYLLKVNRTTLTGDQNPDAALVGTVGHTITITVNSKPTLVGARNIQVTPIANDIGLRMRDWARSRREYVDKVSNGQIAYIYLPDMETAGATEFAKRYYANVDKPGIIIDVRGNGGGDISANILNQLNSKITGYSTFRSGGNYRREAWAPLGKLVAITDEWAFSDGEYFSEYFKRLKLGPLVGHRTGGGEVGSGGGYALVDGGTIYVPNYGAWTGSEWVVEGRGVVPDYEVNQDPASVMAGKDPQLDKAIDLIMSDLKKHPFVIPQHPAFPIKTKGSRVGG